ncbi:MAG TPA: hypothetical protein VNA25_22700 [Phycisphaerae bacterium]|nr:hypothetical protein [Phycisphaerae bacterium]
MSANDDARLALRDIAHEIYYGAENADGLTAVGCRQFADRIDAVRELLREPDNNTIYRPFEGKRARTKSKEAPAYVQCGAVGPDGATRCCLPRGHEGLHDDALTGRTWLPLESQGGVVGEQEGEVFEANGAAMKEIRRLTQENARLNAMIDDWADWSQRAKPFLAAALKERKL